MDKQLLQQILTLGYVRGHCDNAVLYYNSRDLHCDLVSADKTLLCRIKSEKFNGGNNFIGEDRIGIPKIDAFLKMLKTLGDDIQIEIVRDGRNDIHMTLSDSTLQMKYGLTSSGQMPRIPSVKPPSPDNNPIEISITKSFMTKFHKLSGAIKDCKYLFVSASALNLELILSQSEDYNTGAKIDVELTSGHDFMSVLKFDISKMRTILYNNRDCEAGKMQFYRDGMCTIFCTSKNILANYFVISD